jgi:hypothetical protein
MPKFPWPWFVGLRLGRTPSTTPGVALALGASRSSSSTVMLEAWRTFLSMHDFNRGWRWCPASSSPPIFWSSRVFAEPGRPLNSRITFDASLEATLLGAGPDGI